VDDYVSIWDKSPGSSSWVTRHGISSSEYQDAFNQFLSQGYRLKHVSGYAAGNNVRYAAIWETNDVVSWVSRHGLDSSSYQRAFDEYVSLGYGLI
jgi:Bacterial tandem repeat domain 1